MRMGRTAGVFVASLLLANALAGVSSAAPLQTVSHADWMQKKGLLEGDLNGNLALDRAMTTAELATLLARLQGETKLRANSSGVHWASSQLAWAQQKGYISSEEAKLPDHSPSASRMMQIAAAAGYNVGLPDVEVIKRSDVFNAFAEAISMHLTIAHMNDSHGHIQDNKSGGEFGYAKIATLLKQWRQENPNFQLFDAGDTFQGTVFVNQSKGESLPPLLNALGINVMEAGNHEFDYGYKQLLSLRDKLNYPIINANAIQADGSPLLPPVYRFEAGGQKFVVFGLITQETAILTHPDNVKGLTFQDPVAKAKSMVADLKGKGEHVILLSHCGVDVDREIAKQVSGIDLIIGGHTHTKLTAPELVNGTYIVQDWEYLKSLGRSDLYYYKGELVALADGIKEYDAGVPEDPEMAKLVKQVSDEVDQSLNVTIAHTDVQLEGDRTVVRKRESNLGNFITDAMLARSKAIPGYEADVALTNGGGIRTEIKAGDITKKMLYDVLPFPNTVVILDATGSELRDAIENGVSQVEGGAGRFPQISGMSFAWNPSKPAGARVTDIKVGGQPLDLNQTYKIATNDFIAAGGDGYSMLNGKKAYNTGITLYELVEEALTQQGSISPRSEGRITEVNE
ncbi:bifunctional metallophosphatase/5'-nucleotidase [Paenibacillus rigui]|uniref:Multifunctional 2',3'-cyclic-nucleotide 2'-phosphodiesterase/5'-nucleotidase/3'-nucleotidase n=1 Tax=Paenibacillus rigui TaxID=554312 RepID=A0A229ULJ0_9BACL|nr:5'-nucleotidase C-terminal domain-containing protein [Paenibacillus rigui]OXM83769.1 multifunctional 2',3'-cyclic-nucleotide 2'-phosphodiesterase/5'-nucleotidase/3'-nucleotidase [Paenibacillus rigui]